MKRRYLLLLLVVGIQLALVLWSFPSSVSAGSCSLCCCTGVNNEGCSGCILVGQVNGGLVFAQAGNNTYYSCQAYENPVGCETNPTVCFSGTVVAYYGTDCTGAVADNNFMASVSKNSCILSSCD